MGATIPELALRARGPAVSAVGSVPAVPLPVLSARAAAAARNASRRSPDRGVRVCRRAFPALARDARDSGRRLRVVALLFPLAKAAAARGVTRAARRGPALLGARPRLARRLAAGAELSCAGAVAMI